MNFWNNFAAKHPAAANCGCVAGPDFIYNIGTTVLNGGISLVIVFFVNKLIPEGEAAK